MTRDEAAELLIESMNEVAYQETTFSLYDSDKDRLFGSEHYHSGRITINPSTWADDDFEKKMTTLLVWANILNRSAPTFAEAQKLLKHESSILGRVVRKAKRRLWLKRLHLNWR